MKAGILTRIGRWASRRLTRLAGPRVPSPAWAFAGFPLRPDRDGMPACFSIAGGSGDRSRARRIDDLYRKYSPPLYWVCMKYTRNKEDAEDMVNQVFVKVHENLAGFKGQSGIYTWMYRIAVNECIQMLRRRKFEVDGHALEGFEDMLQARPEGELDARLMLRKLVAGADGETAEILFLLYMEGLTQEEVVEKLGISRTTIHRKVTAFKARVEKYR